MQSGDVMIIWKQRSNIKVKCYGGQLLFLASQINHAWTVRGFPVDRREVQVAGKPFQSFSARPEPAMYQNRSPRIPFGARIRILIDLALWPC